MKSYIAGSLMMFFICPSASAQTASECRANCIQEAANRNNEIGLLEANTSWHDTCRRHLDYGEILEAKRCFDELKAFYDAMRDKVTDKMLECIAGCSEPIPPEPGIQTEPTDEKELVPPGLVN